MALSTPPGEPPIRNDRAQDAQHLRELAEIFQDEREGLRLDQWAAYSGGDLDALATRLTVIQWTRSRSRESLIELMEAFDSPPEEGESSIPEAQQALVQRIKAILLDGKEEVEVTEELSGDMASGLTMLPTEEGTMDPERASLDELLAIAGEDAPEKIHDTLLRLTRASRAQLKDQIRLRRETFLTPPPSQGILGRLHSFMNTLKSRWPAVHKFMNRLTGRASSSPPQNLPDLDQKLLALEQALENVEAQISHTNFSQTEQ